MRFLFRMAFWIGLALVVLPFGKAERIARSDPMSPAQTFYAISEAVADVSMLCQRKPEVCAIGRQTIDYLGARAREGALYAFEALDARFGEPDREIVTGAVRRKP